MTQSSASFTVLDKKTSGQVVNVTKIFVPDTNWPNFNRPSEINDEDRLGFGFPKFVHRDILTKRGYAKGDILFIKIRAFNPKPRIFRYASKHFSISPQSFTTPMLS